MKFSFSLCLGVKFVMCYKLMVMVNMWCCVCASNVKVVDKLNFCFGALDDLWRW